MGLVDYSDSDSDSEQGEKQEPKPAPPTAAAAASSTGKKPFQKVVDRSNPGKIRVNLPSATPTEKPSTDGDGPPAKRAKTSGGGLFGGFNSFLPPPKNAGKPVVTSSSGKSAPRPGINLKTGATPGFSRDVDNEVEESYGTDGAASSEFKPPQPTIPEGQKPAEEVKLVGKPLMFKPLSVSRKPTKKKPVAAAPVATAKVAAASSTAPPVAKTVEEQSAAPPAAEPPLKKKKFSLFSISDDPSPANEEPKETSNGSYQPLFTESEPSNAEAFAAYDAEFAQASAATQAAEQDDLDSIANSMNLSAAARRELFGRGGVPSASQSATRVINFNTDKEYAHNEEIRAAGEQQTFNPVRAIAPGKHSLRQLVSQVQNQRDALEESFAKGKSARNEAGSKYGWR